MYTSNVRLVVSPAAAPAEHVAVPGPDPQVHERRLRRSSRRCARDERGIGPYFVGTAAYLAPAVGGDVEVVGAVRPGAGDEGTSRGYIGLYGTEPGPRDDRNGRVVVDSTCITPL